MPKVRLIAHTTSITDDPSQMKCQETNKRSKSV